MPTVTPNAFLGRNIASLTITPQDVAADGTLSNDAVGAKTITGVVKTIRKRSANDVENISTITQRRKNNVIIESGTDYTITGVLVANDSATIGSSTNLVNAIVQAFDYVKLIFTRGGLVETFYGVVQSYEEDFQKGEVDFTLEVSMIDPGSANPSQA